MLSPATRSSRRTTCARGIIASAFCVSVCVGQAFVTFKDAYKDGKLDGGARDANLQAIRAAMKALNALAPGNTIYPIQQSADPTVPTATEAR